MHPSYQRFCSLSDSSRSSSQSHLKLDPRLPTPAFSLVSIIPILLLSAPWQPIPAFLSHAAASTPPHPTPPTITTAFLSWPAPLLSLAYHQRPVLWLLEVHPCSRITSPDPIQQRQQLGARNVGKVTRSLRLEHACVDGLWENFIQNWGLSWKQLLCTGSKVYNVAKLW